MKDIDRLNRIMKRARIVYRIRHAVEGIILVGIGAAAVSFLTMLVVGLGYADTSIWQTVLAGCGGGVAIGAFMGLMRPLNEATVLRRLDRDHKLDNALDTACELLSGKKAADGELHMAHIRQSLDRAERLPFYRALAYDLGPHARILGILCACIISVALI
jgi:hypothetical protein